VYFEEKSMQVRKQMLLKLTGLLGFAGAAILAIPAVTQINLTQRAVAQTTPGVGQPADPAAPGTTTPDATSPGLGTDPTAPGTTTPDATSPGLGTDPAAPGTTTPDATSPDTTTPGVGTPTDTDNNDLDDNGAAGTTQPAGEGVRALW
jgi:hypothetical protein